jgi:hypothetical protein
VIQLAISMKTALQINGGSRLGRYTSLKQLTLLCQAKLVLQKENVNDRREPFYALAPGGDRLPGERSFHGRIRVLHGAICQVRNMALHSGPHRNSGETVHRASGHD